VAVGHVVCAYLGTVTMRLSCTICEICGDIGWESQIFHIPTVYARWGCHRHCRICSVDSTQKTIDGPTSSQVHRHGIRVSPDRWTEFLSQYRAPVLKIRDNFVDSTVWQIFPYLSSACFSSETVLASDKVTDKLRASLPSPTSIWSMRWNESHFHIVVNISVINVG